MPNNQTLPTGVNNSNGLPSIDDVRPITTFILGNLQAGSNPTSATSPWGWLSPNGANDNLSIPIPPAGFTYGNQLLTVDNIRAGFNNVEVRRSNNNWHGRNEYFLHVGTWSPWRTWDSCSSSDEQKLVLGRRGMFDMARRNDVTLNHYESLNIPLTGMDAPDFSSGYYARYPHSIRPSDYAGTRHLGDGDNEVGIHLSYPTTVFGNQTLDPFWSHAPRVRNLQLDTPNAAAGVMIRNTGYGVRQGRDMIDQFARRHIARNLLLAQGNTAPSQAQVNTAAENIPANDVTLRETQGQYRAFLANSRANLNLSTNMDEAIRTLETRRDQAAANSVERDILMQLAQEYRSVRTTIHSIRDQRVQGQDRTYGQVPGFEFLNTATLSPDSLAQLHACPATSSLFFNQHGAMAVNTGWLWTTQFAGFNQTTLSSLMDPQNPGAANTLSQALRFMGHNTNTLFTQPLFSPDAAREHRAEMNFSMMDLPRMTQMLLNPGQSELAENAHFLSAAYRAQFVQPTNPQDRRQMALHRLCLALDSGRNHIHQNDFRSVFTALRNNQYSNQLSMLGITQSDFNEVRDLLSRNGNNDSLPNQVNVLDRHFSALIQRSGQDGWISRENLFLATCPVDISIDNAAVRYSVRNANGELVNVGQVANNGDNPHAYNAARAFGERYRGLNRGFNACSQDLVYSSPNMMGDGLYRQNVPVRPDFAGLSRPTTLAFSPLDRRPLFTSVSRFNVPSETLFSTSVATTRPQPLVLSGI